MAIPEAKPAAVRVIAPQFLVAKTTAEGGLHSLPLDQTSSDRQGLQLLFTVEMLHCNRFEQIAIKKAAAPDPKISVNSNG